MKPSCKSISLAYIKLIIKIHSSLWTDWCMDRIVLIVVSKLLCVTLFLLCVWVYMCVCEYACLLTFEEKEGKVRKRMEVWQVSLKVIEVSSMAQYTLLMLSACSHTTSCQTHVKYIFTWLIFQECILNCMKPQER